MTRNNTDIKINLDNIIKWCNEVLKSVFFEYFVNLPTPIFHHQKILR